MSLTQLVTRPTRGGLKYAQRLLGLRHDSFVDTDDIIMSLDMEVEKREASLTRTARRPYVNQLAIATLDTRYLKDLASTADLKSLIPVRLFQSVARSEMTDHSSPVSAGTIIQKQVTATVLDNLLVIDKLASAAGKHRYRQVVLVGQSIWEDLRSLRLLGFDAALFSIIPMILDTHEMARHLFPPFHPKLDLPSGQDFSLADVLARFGHRPDSTRFHNATNDAVYTLHLLLFLVYNACKESMNHKIVRRKPETINHCNLAKLGEWLSLLTQDGPATVWEERRQQASEVSSHPVISSVGISPLPKKSLQSSGPGS
jgi:hypothetical protein